MFKESKDPLGWITKDKSHITGDKSFNILMLNLKDVEPDQTQPRKSFEKIEELAESIKRHGLLHPILVRKENGKYKIISGQRRYMAHKFLGQGFETIKAIELTKESSDILPIQLVENIQRSDLRPLELASSLKDLQDRGFTVREIAELVGKSKSTVHEHLGLLEIKDEELKKKADISPTKALKINKVKNKKEKKSLIDKFEDIRVAKLRENKNLFDFDKSYSAKVKDLSALKTDVANVLNDMESSLKKAGEVNIRIKIIARK
ncbi:MAG: ParB/RepB/Spo0J family partition protein [bacterium]|jgi:ParB family chromosome partitioning protein